MFEEEIVLWSISSSLKSGLMDCLFVEVLKLIMLLIILFIR